MAKLNKILVPTDFSKGSERAYTMAQNVRKPMITVRPDEEDFKNA